jgi:hypothetical protein
MKNFIVLAAVLVACLLPFTVASAGLRSDAAPIGDAVQDSDELKSPVIPADDEAMPHRTATDPHFTVPEVRGSITVNPLAKKVVSNHGQFRAHHAVTCDPVVYVLGGSFQNCR